MTSMRFIWTLIMLSEAARGFDLCQSDLGTLLHPWALNSDAMMLRWRALGKGWVSHTSAENRAHPQRAGEHEV